MYGETRDDTLTNVPHRKYTDTGCYPVFYITGDGDVICPECADKDVDEGQAPVDLDVNWEDPTLYCDDCGKRIESAYAEDEAALDAQAATLAMIACPLGYGVADTYTPDGDNRPDWMRHTRQR